ncbi:3-ketoacyl-thiolase peroxisomal [Micractinium conductrix]|uniref:acetyl-CoA C-acyltransferase n=1 Tax=Micractinium conductrix TaxID=554055 RepID=A0A2P6VH65_9CHLO|nr:3-ketoacyl-thiolase peroxisomal [Micractinium conductrix]|eukprot:PSC73425.1 3-ketoacyl-thiolase peroxisomal [Micractinium conductrix]
MTTCLRCTPATATARQPAVLAQPHQVGARPALAACRQAAKDTRPSAAPRLPRRCFVIKATAAPEAPSSTPKTSSGLHDVVIVGAVRTPMCKAKAGALRDAPLDDLVVTVLKDLLRTTGVDPKEIGDVCFGSGLGPSSKRANEVRTALLLAGFPSSVPAYTVNRQCAAGLQSIADMAASIAAGYLDIGIAGGVESMSHSPMVWEGSENPRLEENPEAKDCLLPMGITSDNVASRYNVPRDLQDRLASESHAKAKKAQDSGIFAEEIAPVQTIQLDDNGQAHPVVIDRDDGIRPDFTFEKLSKLRGCFQRGGSTTVGNACQTTDGAAAVMLMRREEAERRGLKPLAALKSFAAVGVPPSVMGIGPAVAIPKALERAGLSKEDISVFEINEAFASQFAYCLRELDLPEEKVNPNGGAMALGHPIGATGARLTVTLLHELARRAANGKPQDKYGVVSMCVGSGMGAAAVFEAEPQGSEVAKAKTVDRRIVAPAPRRRRRAACAPAKGLNESLQGISALA